MNYHSSLIRFCTPWRNFSDTFNQTEITINCENNPAARDAVGFQPSISCAARVSESDKNATDGYRKRYNTALTAAYKN